MAKKTLEDNLAAIEQELKGGNFDSLGSVINEANDITPKELAKAARWLYFTLGEKKAVDVALSLLGKYSANHGHDKMREVSLEATFKPEFPKPMEIYFIAAD